MVRRIVIDRQRRNAVTETQMGAAPIPTLAAQSGASLRDLMTRMGHDSPAAALIYQHSSRVADEAIAAALDARLSERKSRPLRNVVGPVEGPTEPQLIAVEPGRFGKKGV
jgi:hypothetical protein